MTQCLDGCPLEDVQRDVRSPGPVEANELVARASYDPRHYKKNKVQSSVIRATDLFAGTLSVWRVSGKASMTLPGLSAKLQADCEPGQTIKALHPVSVDQIRRMKTEDKQSRLFCVVDECDVDDQGGHHHAHAHIRICDHLKAQMPDMDCDLFRYAKSALVQAAKANQVAHPAK